MSKTPLMAKTLQPYPKQSKISELHELTFQSIFGALELQFALGPFYTFVAKSLMVLYQLESIHFDDSNLIYSQNKNRGFTEILTEFTLLYNMILMPSIQIFFFSNQFQCISRVKIYPKTHGNYQKLPLTPLISILA